MSKFSKKLSCLALLILGTTAVLFVLPFFLPDNGTEYIAAYIDKHRLLDSTPSPRIIVIGGSSAAFGVDSELIAKQTGYPVINMGLNIGMGLQYMLEEVRPEIGRGDVILLSPEYEQFESTFSGRGAPPTLIAITPMSIKYMTLLKQYLHIFSGLNDMTRVETMHLLGAIRGRPVSCVGGLYCRASFDTHGDFVAHLGLPTRLQVPEHMTPSVSTPTPASLQAIADFTAYAESRGARVLFSFPPFARSYFELNKTGINTVAEGVKKIPGLIVIDAPEDHEYANDLFFDSEYHLSKEGRNIRTNQILKASKITPL